MTHPAILDWPEQPSDDLPLALWDADAIASATGGTVHGSFQVSGVEIDSRDVGEGDLFVALKGAAMDGHRFVAGAFERGAAGVLVSQPVDGPHVLVDDTQAALEALGAAARARADMQVVGVTGSVGKTSTKEALFAALDRASRGAAHASVKSYNNHTGVPLSLARTPARSHYGVYEMGMNHAGEIAALTTQVRPHVALVTAIAPAHIENLGSEENIARAKAEIFEGLEPGGIAIVPADSPHAELLAGAAQAVGASVTTFGLESAADIKLLESVTTRDGGSLLTVQVRDRRLCFTIGNPGRHWVSNALAVIAACDALGADLGAAGLALADLQGLKIRATSSVGRGMQAIGASPVSITTAEMYEAMQRGQIECAVGSTAWLNTYNLKDFTKLAWTNSLGSYFGTMNFAINKDSWDDLSPEHQQVFKDQMAGNVADIMWAYIEESEEGLTWLKENGGTVKEADQAFVDAWTKVQASAVDETIAQGKADGVEHADEIITTFMGLVDKWTKIMAEIGDDKAAYQQKLQEEIFSKI